MGKRREEAILLYLGRQPILSLERFQYQSKGFVKFSSGKSLLHSLAWRC
ncbi:hypothetical protein CsSME_00039250 [Camellia sinensis var. sinensis]